MTPVATSVDVEPALDTLLGQLISGSLVLTDGQGAISKWSDDADLLFGRAAGDVLGRGFFSTLIAAPLAPAGEGWRRFLEGGEAPAVRAKVELHALHASGHAFVVELVFIPVKLDEGFDFSLFLEDLAFELPLEQMIARLRAQHPVVMHALRAALSESVQPWEGWRTAGTLIAFRPLAATPWVAAELAARERAAALEAEASLAPEASDPELGVDAADAIGGFADASQIVERLLGAVHKLDALETAGAELPRALEAAEVRAAALAAELEARVSQLEWTSGAERERVGRLEADTAAPVPFDPSALEARLAALESAEPVRFDPSPLEARLAALEAAPEGPDPELVGRLDAGQAALRDQEERLARLEGPTAQELRDAVQAAVRLAQDAADRATPAAGGLEDEAAARLHARLDALAAELASVRSAAASATERVDVALAVGQEAGAEVRGPPAPGRAAAARPAAALAAAERAGELESAVEVARERSDALASDVRSAQERWDALASEVRSAHERSDELWGAVRATEGRVEALDAEVHSAQEGAGALASAVRAAEERADRALAAAEDAAALGADGGSEPLRGRLAAVEAALDGERRASTDAADELALLRDGAAALTTTVEAVQATTEQGFAELRAELTGVLASVESHRTGFEEARHSALAARRDAEEARTAAAAAGSATQRSAQQLSSAWRELLSPGGVGTGSGDRTLRTLPSREPKVVPPPRTPRDGFDDQPAPMAVLALDGHFRELNPAFATLVGYPEHEFRKAVWPSAHDRGAYRDQQEQLRLLAAGEVDSVGLRSTYMHGQGLMVPVTGRISVVRGEDGQPAHLLLRAEERASR